MRVSTGFVEKYEPAQVGRLAANKGFEFFLKSLLLFGGSTQLATPFVSARG
jgi:hypothetical protein